MGWTSDFAEGFEKPWKWAWDKLEKTDRIADKTLDGAGNIAEGLANLFNGNTLLYIGLAVVGIVVIPIVLQKVL